MGNKMREVYNQPGDIDAYTGGLAEQFQTAMVGDRYFFSHPEGGQNQERGMGTSQTRSSIQRRKLRDIICDNGRSKVTRTQRFVMRMVSGENPRIPCQAEKTDLDFDGIVRDIVAQQEAIKKSISWIDS